MTSDSLNADSLRHKLRLAPDEHISSSNIQIRLPLPNGKFGSYTVYDSPILSKSLAAQFPELRTFRIIDNTNPENSGRLDITPRGFHAMLNHGGKVIFIDPYGDSDLYQSYYASDYMEERGGLNHSPINCLFGKHNHFAQKNHSREKASKADVSFGADLKTYRIAIAATGEFTAFHGGTKDKALAAMVTGLNRVNQVYERDLAIKLELVGNNSDVIYTDAATDPYTDDDPDALIEEVGADLNSKVGVDNYDIGHVFSTGGGGIAGFGVVCGPDKAEGVTGRQNPINDPFFIDFVAHEMGHQFGADHTFNGTAESCEGNREPLAAYEPGSATTIMGYAGLCGEEDIQQTSDAYFHNHSLGQISEFITDANTGGSCGVSSNLNNAAPVPNAGNDSNIPRSTSFILTGTATDADGNDGLSYNWEQYDLGAETTGKASFTDDGSRPLFRSFSPSSSPNRTFPQIADILSGTTTYGEILPTTARDLNFRFTVRDGKGGVASDSVKVAVSDVAGPFTVTAPAAASWDANSSQTVTWDVANTTAAPINCANVEITLSSDGGQTFGTTIIASTPNDGSETVTVPNSETTTGRIRIKCVTQPFFAINSVNITINAAGGNTNPVANNDSFTVAQDSSATSFAVLANDTDADNDTLSITGVSNMSNGGTATINGTNVDYTPANGFSGTETFNYAIRDGNGGTAEASVSVTVTASNNAPVANDDSFTVTQNSSTTSFAVLDNDTDADNDTLSITGVTNISNGGTATVNGTSINYRPASGFNGTETFTYAISDGNGGTDEARVTVTVTATNTGGGSNGGGSKDGGGSFGLFLLLMLGFGGYVKNKRTNGRINRNRTA